MKNLLIIGLLIGGLSACGNSDSKSETPTASDPNQFLTLRETIEDDLEQNNAVAASVAIYKEGEIIFAEAFGEKIKDSGVAITPDTLFQLGSTTKMFTGLATLQLIQQGVLSKDDKLVNTLPNIQYPSVQAQTWQDISIHHLLSNQSGLSDSYIDSDSNSSLVDYMTTGYPQYNRQMNPPGIFYNYSNPNFSYLGAIVEHLTQTPYVEHMQQSVFEPLGMSRTWLDRSMVIADGDYALGYQEGDEGGIFMTDINQIPLLPATSPAGAETWSTPKQQLKMAEFLLEGNTDILSDDWRKEITSAQISQEFLGLPKYYGYGMFVEEGFEHNEEWYQEKIWQHGGNTTAYTNLLWILPEKKIAISIMSSGGFDDFSSSMIAALESVTELVSPQETPVIPTEPNEYYKHEGTYSTGELIVSVSEEDNELYITIPEFDAANVPYEPKLVPLADKSFYFVINDGVDMVTFLPHHEGGESAYIVNRNFVGIKDGY